MMRGTLKLAVAAALLTGCGSSDTTEPGNAPTTQTTSAAASSTSNANSPLTPGSETTISGDNGAIGARVTVYSVTQNAAPTAPRPVSGGHWVAVDARTCLDKAPVSFTVSWDVWTVADADYGNYPASSLTYNQFPKPMYPFSEGTVPVGDCVRGAILFPVPDGITITRVKYAPNPAVTATWSAS